MTAGGQVDHGQVVEDYCQVRVIGAERLLVYLRCPLVKGLRLQLSSGAFIEFGKVNKFDSYEAMLYPVILLCYRQYSLQEGLGLGVATQFLVYDGQIVEGG